MFQFDISGFTYYDKACWIFSKIKPGPLAQSVEQQTFNLWVVGSIPTGPTQLIFQRVSNLLIQNLHSHLVE